MTYRLRLRVAHLLAITPESRERVFVRMGQLYSIRSAIVHTGSQDVTEDDLATSRLYAGVAVLEVLSRLGERPNLEAWFLEAALR